ncbi:MAG TPA: O-antigen ligase family protein [Usitatibacter sp.]|nr:O-antigen ligase family protein [Usitatibacter sp.]
MLLCLLVWAPIPLGSNRMWAWSLLEVGIFALVCAWLLMWTAGWVRAPSALVRAWPAFALLALWLGEQVLYVVPLPPSWVALLSPESARMQHLTDALGIARASMTLSVDPYATRMAILKGLAYAGAFFLVLVLANNRQRILTLARALVYAAVVMSIYGVLMHLAGVQEEYFGSFIDHASQASATYVNRNHFAGYLEMTLALGIGLLIAGLSDRSADTWRRFVTHLLDWVLSPKMVLRLALCILVIALTTTHSRMGNTGFFSSLLVAGVIGIALSRHATRNTVVLLASLIVIDLLIVGSWFGVEKLAQRLEQTTMGEVEVREEPAAYTIAMIRDYPLFGSGPGSFYVTFPRYRPATVVNFFDFAHNDYAQFASESGLLGLAILGLLVAVTLAAAVKAQWLRRDPLMRGMSFACIMGVTAILIHSWVDFNLQIPANAVYFMVLLALGWVSLHSGRSDNGAGVRRETD